MTYAVSRDYGAFEWAGKSLAGVFTQPRNLFSPHMWRMIFDIIRFNQFALDLFLVDQKGEEYININGVVHHTEHLETIGQYLERKGYSRAFREDYLIPRASAAWSTSPEDCPLDLPAVTLVRFMWTHHLLSTFDATPQWLTLKYGARSYIEVIMKGFPSNHVFLNTPVESIVNDASGRVQLNLVNGESRLFDHVIVATHGDQAYNLIKHGASPEERRILSEFQTSLSTAVLHSDVSLMPRSRPAWSSCNYIATSAATSSGTDQACTTYNMNALQNIPEATFGPVLVTLNPIHQPDPALVQGRFTYAHPLHHTATTRAQRLLPRIQNTRGISYCGAWTGYGFHEDGFSSGLKVARDHLGANLPFKLKAGRFNEGQKPIGGVLGLLVRLGVVMLQIIITVVERLFVAQRARREQLGLREKKWTAAY